jgi:hypothetical protein
LKLYFYFVASRYAAQMNLQSVAIEVDAERVENEREKENKAKIV